METMLDIMGEFSTGSQYPRDFLDKLYGCWDTVDPSMKKIHNRIWQVTSLLLLS